METIYQIRHHSFRLDAAKAEESRAGKRVILGREPAHFSLFPVKYEWACEKYGIMMANHWEPEDIPMQRDVEQWRSDHVTPNERWIIMMGIGYFSAAEGIVGDNIQHVVRDLVTTAELRMVLGRHAHEENIHADSLLYMISALGINPHECEAMFEQIPTIVKKNEFVTRHSKNLRRDLDLTQLENQQLLAKNLFVFGQCMEGTQFYGLFAMILSLKRQGKFVAVGEMFEYTLRDETNHIEIFRNLFLDLITENPAICTQEFQEDLVATMREAKALEKEFIRDCLPGGTVGLTVGELEQYIDFIADARLRGCGLPVLNPGVRDPLPWLDEAVRMLKEKNFFEGRVTSYQKVASFMSEVFKSEPSADAARKDPRTAAWPAGHSAGVSLPIPPQEPAEHCNHPPSARHSSKETTYTIGNRQFHLDKSKAEAAFVEKKVINGRETLTFNLLPLRYEWAYDIYKQMKAEHWGPMSAEIQMHLDAQTWTGAGVSENERRMLQMCLGWLAVTARLPGSEIQHHVRSVATAPELKLVLGRETQDNNIRLDVLLFSAWSLGVNPHQCEELFENAALIDQRRKFVKRHGGGLTRGIDLTRAENRRLFAKGLFLAGQCLKGLQGYGLLAVAMSVLDHNKFPGLVRMLSYLIRTDTHYIDVFGCLLQELKAENPELEEPAFGEELACIMREAVTLEKSFLRNIFCDDGSCPRLEELERFIDHAADCRLRACKLPLLNPGLPCPLPQLAGLMHLHSESGRPAAREVLTPCSDDEF